ncbi:dermokine [Mesoplodon densirostris]|uniref:dermokine n=1 Tax=Mesoplodon densirostris TaxID=48708 RepID=UPI0028DAFD97|nr:dermokine [Mesoplodon densirostris]
MKPQGCLACLLLVLCLGNGEAGPLLSGGESAGAGAMEATGHGVEEAIGQELGEAIKHGVGEATGGGDGEAVGSGVKETMGPGVRDALARGVEEAAHALGNTGSEAGRQAENVIQHGVDAAHSSWQGMPGGNGALAAVAQPPHGSGRGSDNPSAESQTSPVPFPLQCTNLPPSGSGGGSSSHGRNSGGSSGPHWVSSPLLKAEVGPLVVPAEETHSEVFLKAASPRGRGPSGGGEAVRRTNTLNSQPSPGLFNFDTLWKNLKSMLGFFNGDVINKGRVPDLSTRILLYFRQLWENFKRNTPFLNWKAITENYDCNQQTHLTATGGQPTTKGGVTISSSEGITTGNNAAGSEETSHAQFLDIDKLRSVFRPNEYLNWPALFELRGMKDAAANAQ